MSFIKRNLKRLAITALVAFLLLQAWWWIVCRVYVGPGEVLVVIDKFGDELPAHLVVVPRDSYGTYKGIREEVLGPGRYFFNPIFHETKLVPATVIRVGEPERWEWTPDGHLKRPETAPHVGLVTVKQGAEHDAEVVPAGHKGIQQGVLTPGVYKLNPYLVEVREAPAVVIPPGSVGVVTRLFGDAGQVVSAPLTEIVASTTSPTTRPEQARRQQSAPSRLVAGPNQRGVLRDVLQPGIYYLNPRMYKVDVVPVGYDQITLEAGQAIHFLSADGYQVEADFTVVWGITPADAPTIVANIGGWAAIEDNVLKQAMISACQNEGAKFTAKELIQGLTRSAFQDALSASLEQQVASRNVHVLLALVRNIAVRDNTGQDATDGLLATIQRANIEVERQVTNRQKTQTERTRAELEEAMKLVDVARETVAGETKVKVANLLADGAKRAAEIDAQRDLAVAAIQLEVAALEAQTSQILGKAAADVDRMRNDAEATGAQLLVEAFGGPQAYNAYTFARNFRPQDLRLIFAGEGTLWTDLKSLHDVAATKVVTEPAATPATTATPRR